MKHRSVLGTGLAVAALALVFASAATAQETQTRGIGGQGGSPAKLDCGQDGALVGVNARVGNFIDSLQPICRKIRGNELAGDIYTTASAGGGGGVAVQRLCPTGSVVTALSGSWNARSYNFPGVQVYTGANYVHEVSLRCQRWNGNASRFDNVSTITVAGRQPGSERLQPTDSAGWCPVNSVGSALVVRAGIYVDNVALVCDAQRFRRPRQEVVECPATVDTKFNVPGNDWRDVQSPPLRLWRASVDRQNMICDYVATTDRSAQPQTWRMVKTLPEGGRCEVEPGTNGRVRCNRFGGDNDRPWGRPWEQR